MKRIKSSDEGFTLIEVLVAMLVLAIGLLGLAGMTVVVLRSNSLSKQLSEATTVASNLMDTLKIQSSLPNCTSTLSTSSSCKILIDSGIVGLSSGDFLPPPTNADSTCAIENVIDANALTFDVVSANSITASSFSSSSTVCDLSTTTLQQGRYVRYYRTFQPSGGGSNERAIIVVVLWKDKFGKWRNVHLQTTRNVD